MLLQAALLDAYLQSFVPYRLHCHGIECLFVAGMTALRAILPLAIGLIGCCVINWREFSVTLLATSHFIRALPLERVCCCDEVTCWTVDFSLVSHFRPLVDAFDGLCALMCACDHSLSRQVNLAISCFHGSPESLLKIARPITTNLIVYLPSRRVSQCSVCSQ